MPFYLKDRELSSDLVGVRSALIVPCRFCPAAALAVRTKSPYMELSRSFPRTAAYESYIQALKSRLEGQGIRTEVFDSKSPLQYVVCMWGAGRREKLARQAAGYDAVIVLGCDAAAETARQATKSNGCRVIQGMEAEGIMNVAPSVQFPFKVRLEVRSVTRVLEHDAGASAPDEKVAVPNGPLREMERMESHE